MVLEVCGMYKSFKKPTKVLLLEDLNLKVCEGESLAIMGASGAGKSTLLHILGSLEKPDHGQVLLYGQPILQQPAKIRNQEIGFIFQSFFLMEHLTVLQNVLMPAMIARKSTRKSSQATQKALELLKKVGLYENRNQLAKSLSGGEKQRTCIARALINDPSIVFADEPTGNLDNTSSVMIQDLLLKNIRDTKKSLIVVTHDPRFAKKCDRTLWLTSKTLTDQAPSDS